jgi:anti-anti-sigma factor
MDSSGVALLLSLWRRCRREGVTLMIARLSPAVRRVLELCGVAGLLPIADDGDGAPSP